MTSRLKRTSPGYRDHFTGPIPGYDHAAKIRQLPCCACSTVGPSEPHHQPTRGAGGAWRDIVPLCLECHREVHSLGRRTFERKYRVDLEAIAYSLLPEDYR